MGASVDARRLDVHLFRLSGIASAFPVSKAATDKMTADMAVELRPYGVTVVSLYPGLVRTEKVMEAAAWLDLTNSESPEFMDGLSLRSPRIPTSSGTPEPYWWPPA